MNTSSGSWIVSWLRLSLLFVVFVLLLFILPKFCSGQERSKSSEEDREALQRIADKIAKLAKERSSDGRAGSRGPRSGYIQPVPADALDESRGEIEDYLRMYLLATSRGETFDRMKEILNSQWGANTVKALWELDTFHPFEYSFLPRRHRARVLALLVFAADRYKGEVFDEVMSILDSIFKDLMDPGFQEAMPPGPYSEFKSKVRSALYEYGTLRLLPPSFWTAVQDERVGNFMILLLGEIGNKDNLKWLEEFQKTCEWEDQFTLKTAIETLKKKLAKEKTEERDRPEHTEQPEPPVKKPTPEQQPRQHEPSAEHESSGDNLNWFLPMVIIGIVVIVGFAIFFLLRRKKDSQ